MSFKQDHFSGHAAAYAKHRPGYPDALFAALAALAPRHRRVWDCATGQGQAARSLAAHFDEVIATDASTEQLAHAKPHPSVRFHQATAEDSGIEPGSVDLVTVAAGVHWFDRPRFYDEVRRVAAPGAVLAVWSYAAALDCHPPVQAVLEKLAFEILAPHWPQAMSVVAGRYDLLDFPFEELELGAEFAAEAELDLQGLSDHIRTWSGAQRYQRATGKDPLHEVKDALREAWGEAARRLIRWPLFSRTGRVHGR